MTVQDLVNYEIIEGNLPKLETKLGKLWRRIERRK